MAVIVALLRGVNVGGHARVPMAGLRSVLMDLGFERVQTHLQSGNVVLDHGKVKLQQVSAAIETAIAEDFGLKVRVIVRTRKELAGVAAGHPLNDHGSSPSRLHVVFMEKAPAAAKMAALDPDRSPPDRFEVQGREIYLSYPNGQGRSKLSLDYFERVLEVVGTARNWNTVTRLLEMVS